MVMLRQGDVPLRTNDGGKSWKPLVSTSALLPKGGTSAGSYSRRRDCHSAAPPSPFSRRISGDNEGVPAK